MRINEKKIIDYLIKNYKEFNFKWGAPKFYCGKIHIDKKHFLDVTLRWRNFPNKKIYITMSLYMSKIFTLKKIAEFSEQYTDEEIFPKLVNIIEEIKNDEMKKLEKELEERTSREALMPKPEDIIAEAINW